MSQSSKIYSVILLLIVLMTSNTSFAQRHTDETIIDKSRLIFDETKLNSRQKSFDMSSSGKYIAYAFEDGVIRIFDTDINRFISWHKYDYKGLWKIRFSKDENRLLCIDENSWKVFDWKSKRVLHTESIGGSPADFALGNKKDLFAITILKSKEVKIYDFESFTLLSKYEKRGWSSSLAFSDEDDQLLVTTINPKRVQLIDVRTGSVMKQLDLKGFCCDAFFMPGQSKVFLYSALHYLNGVIWDYNSNTTEYQKRGTGGKGDVLEPIGISPYKGYMLLVAYSRGILRGRSFVMTKTNRDTNNVIFTTRVNLRKAKFNLAQDEYFHPPSTNIRQIPNTSKFLINAFGNNVNQIFDVEKKKIVGYIFVDSNDNYAIIGKDGRMEGTKDVISKAYWTKKSSSEMISLETTFNKYYTPKLLSLLISDQAEASTELNIENDIEDLPEISLYYNNISSVQLEEEIESTQIKSSKKRIELQVNIESFETNCEQIKLYHNGKLSSVQEVNTSTTYNFTVNLNSSFGKENYIHAVASTKNNMESEKAKLTIIYENEVEAKPILYTFIIGINNYKNPRYQLNYALTDAEGIKEELEKSKSSLFETIEVTTLFDDEVTKQKIKEVFAEIGSTMKEQDMFLFYYAGHGTMDEQEGNQEFYIVPYDVTQLYGNEQILKDKALSASEIRELSIQLNAQKQVFIIDACHSAGALDAIATRGAAEERAIAQLARSTGTFWLTAAGSEQFATEFEKLGHGVFTYSLLEAFAGKDQASAIDGTLTIRELSAYVEQRVPELSEEHKGKPQYPASFSFGNDFPIILFEK